jgi:hypothetical protein
VVVVFAAAVFVLQAAVAQSVQLAVPLAWQLAPERDVPRVVPPAEQDAQSVPCEWLVAQSGVSPGDLLAVHLALLSAAHSAASLADPQAVHLEPAYSSAVHLALPSAAHSDALPGDPLAGC